MDDLFRPVITRVKRKSETGGESMAEGERMRIRKATPPDTRAVADLALLLWPGHEAGELKEEMAGVLQDPDSAVLLAEEGGLAVAFLHASLRREYVEGARTSPVGYLEGIYVREGWRRRGLGAALGKRCESWARGRGCREMASDCELSNGESLLFHRAVGFLESGRNIHFIKPL